MKGLLIIGVAFVILLSVNSQNMFRGVFQKNYKRFSDPKYYRLYSQYYGTYSKRSSDFYNDPENYGYYAYHGKGYKRSSDFYNDPENYGYYAYHGKGYKRSSKVARSDKVGLTPLRDFRTKRLMRRTIPKLTHMDFKNITTCQYKSNNGSFLSCFNSLVHRAPLICKVDLNISAIKQFDFNKFGVESLISNSTEKKFHLYPFKVNEKTSNRIFYNYQIIFNQQRVELVLYHSPKSNYSGINVKDKECFQKLTNLLEKSSEIKTIDFEISSKNALTKILFIGDIFIE